MDRQETRRVLGPVGAFLPLDPGDPTADQRAAARRLEDLGYPVAWTNEVIGKDALVQPAVALAATERIAVGTSIANLWARPAPTLHGAATALAAAYPDRLVLGLGVGYPQQAAAVGREFGQSLTTVREYVGVLADRTYPLLVAANKPKMLALAGELADGALPAPSSPAATAHARATLGPEPLLVAYVGTGSGPADEIAALVHEHLEAGADHVIAGVAYGTSLRDGLERMEQLAPVLLSLRCRW